ncbi:hypothetical protein [Bacillus sp. B-jedd]|uniref:hypothetical protein n=1 Tax=Bacillus sp. B-jedd TaxID=1476857 RepID=UPI0005155FF3|nr:hypothetical protein [Bacillus sp. B-jedd]CEG27246.1 hypothetical protein BN1002_02102 [Bacillus sp. B-jedd]
MKKYILPIGILIISFFFLNFVNEPTGKSDNEKVNNIEEKKEKPPFEPELISEEGQHVKPTKLYQGTNMTAKLPKKEVEEAAKRAETLEIGPYMQSYFSFEIYPNDITISEWHNGQESELDNSNTYESGGLPGVKLLILRTQWENKDAAVYLAKVRVKNVYSYQKFLSTDNNNFTVIGFFEEGDLKIEMPKPVKDFYSVALLQGTLASFKDNLPELDIEKLPSYYVFKKGKIKYKTKDYDQLHAFLNQDNIYTYEGNNDNWQVRFTVNQNLRVTSHDLTIQYIGKNKKSLSAVSFELVSPSWGWYEEAINIEQDGRYQVGMEMDMEISKEDIYKCIIKWDGMEEEITLKYAE